MDRTLARRNGHAPKTADRPLGELLGDLSGNLGLLVRQELELAKAELKRSAERVGKSAVSIGIGAAVGYTGIMAMVAGVVLGLVRLGVAPWFAALVIGTAFALVGFTMVKRARHDMSQTHITPRRTVRTIREDVEWAKEQVT
jgi:hypothetical protein